MITMVTKILGKLLGSRAGALREQNSVSLGFLLNESPSGEVVSEVPGRVNKRVIKLGASYFYAIGGKPPSGSGMRMAAISKSKVIDVLSSMDVPITPSLFDTARKIANDALGGLSGGEDAELLSYMVAHDTVGYGPISVLLEDSSNLEEIEINSPNERITVCTSNFGRCTTNISFTNEQSFRQNINRFIYDTEKELGESAPIIDAQVGGARIHAQIKPYAINGGAASIRLGKGKALGSFSLLKNQTLYAELLAYLWLAV